MKAQLIQLLTDALNGKTDNPEVCQRLATIIAEAGPEDLHNGESAEYWYKRSCNRLEEIEEANEHVLVLKTELAKAKDERDEARKAVAREKDKATIESLKKEVTDLKADRFKAWEKYAELEKEHSNIWKKVTELQAQLAKSHTIPSLEKYSKGEGMQIQNLQMLEGNDPGLYVAYYATGAPQWAIVDEQGKAWHVRNTSTAIGYNPANLF